MYSQEAEDAITRNTPPIAGEGRKGMTLDDILIITSGEHLERQWRSRRLYRIQGWITSRANALGAPNPLMWVYSMEDYKGELTVTWRTSPFPADQEEFNLAWASADVGDGGGQVKHRMIDGESLA